MNEIEIYKMALDAYGLESQICMVIEECSELITVICHAQRDRATVVDIAQEVADVEIMCGQLRQVIGSDIVDHCKKEKLIRLEQRIKKLRNRRLSK